MNIKNLSNKTGAENYAAHMARQINSEEESTMESTGSKLGMFKNLAAINPTRLIIGLSLGVTLLTATTVSLAGPVIADSLHKTTNINVTQDLSDEEWISGSPFIELNPGSANTTAKVASDNGLPITADDQWVFGSPFVELNPGLATVAELTITADDEWVFGAPFVQSNRDI